MLQELLFQETHMHVRLHFARAVSVTRRGELHRAVGVLVVLVVVVVMVMV